MAARTPLEMMQQRMRAVDRRRLLRPMRSTELLDVALRAYQVLGHSILRLTALPMLLCYAGLTFAAHFILPNLAQTSNPHSATVQVSEVMFVVSVGLLVAMPLFLVGIGYSMGVAVRLVSDFVLGNPVHLGAAVLAARASAMLMARMLLGVLLRSCAVLMVSGLLLLASALAEQAGGGWFGAALTTAILGLIAGGLTMPFVLYRLALAPAALVLEGVKPKDAYRRSAELMRKTKYQPAATETIVSTWLTLGFVALVLYGGVQGGLAMLELTTAARNWSGSGLAGEIAYALLSQIPAYVVLLLVTPIWSAACTVLYYDRRSRLEAYDIAVLAQDVLKADRRTVWLH